MRSTEVARIVDISTQTVRDWSNRYKEFLSPSAKPSRSGAIREFTDDDIRVFLTIKQDADRRLSVKEIKEILKSGKRVEEIPEPVIVEEENVSQSEHTMALAKINALQIELNLIRDKHDQEVARLVKQNDELKVDRDEALEELGKRDKDISDMRYRIGYLEGQIEQLQERLGEARDGYRPKRRGIFGD